MRGLMVVGLVVMLAGCGASEQQKVEAVVRATDAAFERYDVDEVCARMTTRARQRYMQDGTNPRARTCSEATEDTDTAEFGVTFATVLEIGPSDPPRLTDIRVDGDAAVAIYSDGHRTRLRRIDG